MTLIDDIVFAHFSYNKYNKQSMIKKQCGQLSLCSRNFNLEQKYYVLAC